MKRAGWRAGERRLASCVLALAVALAAIPGLGCQATTMTAQGAPVPVLIGPVACVGCAPGTPAGPVLAPIRDSSSARIMVTGGAYQSLIVGWVRGQPTLGMTIAMGVQDPCHVDVRVARLNASAMGLFAFLFVMTSVEIQIDATANLVQDGRCPGYR